MPLIVSPSTTVWRAMSAAGTGAGSGWAPDPGRASRWPGKMRLDHDRPFCARTSAVASPKRSAMPLTVSPSPTTYSDGVAVDATAAAWAAGRVLIALVLAWRLTGCGAASAGWAMPRVTAIVLAIASGTERNPRMPRLRAAPPASPVARPRSGRASDSYNMVPPSPASDAGSRGNRRTGVWTSQTPRARVRSFDPEPVCARSSAAVTLHRVPFGMAGLRRDRCRPDHLADCSRPRGDAGLDPQPH